MVEKRQHAVVLGASMGGLLAARALADRFEHVTLVERDAFPAFGEQRKGVPQGRHAHGLLAGGLRSLEAFFPGLTAALAARGAQTQDIGHNHWIVSGHRLHAFDSGRRGLSCSRPALEGAVRSRVLALPNVSARESHDVLGVVHERGAIVAARVLGRRDAASEELLPADLVVDATGRGSKLPAWLLAEGYAAPEEERVRVDIGYVSALFRRRPEHLHGSNVLVIAAAPPNPRCGVALAIDPDHWLVTLPGYFGQRAPATHEGMLEFSKNLPVSDLYELLKTSEPASDVVSASFPHTQRRRYERLTHHPDGLIAFGDALCSFNPIFGQGMTVCALQAEALSEALASGTKRLWRRFYRKASAIIETPWTTAVSNDLRFAEVVGQRSYGWKSLNGYVQAVLETAAADPMVAASFLQVTNMLAPPSSLMAPGVIGRVLWRALRGRTVGERGVQAEPRLPWA
jgi:2-polyprenyl-6-methoxyphenol hydroxylase-like FAD-dependent oxidoreductase